MAEPQETTSTGSPRERTRRLGAPLLLGLLLTLASAAFVVVEMAQPPPQPGFRGIALSNAVLSPGARAGLNLFRARFSWLPYPASGLILSPPDYLHGLRIAVSAMAAVQALALVTALRRPAGPLWPWLIGPAAASCALLAYPPINTDVFSYASFGWVAERGANPYLVAPAGLRGDPFASMNDWTHIATPYGPFWTAISRIVVASSGGDPFAAAIAFKVVSGLAGLGLGLAAYVLARRLSDSRQLALGAFILTAWSPTLLAESAGMAHNDAVMMLPAICGLLLAASGRRGALRGGLLLVASAVLIKPVAAPLLGLLALMRWRQTPGATRTLARRWLGDAAAVAATIGLAFAPFWAGGRLPNALWTQQKLLYLDKPLKVNPLWVWAMPQLGRHLGGDAARDAAAGAGDWLSRIGAIALLATAVAIAIRPHLRTAVDRVGESIQPIRAQVAAWTAATVGLGLIPINAHAWYAIWPLAPVAVASAVPMRTRPRVWIAVYLGWLLLSFLVYHTWPTIAVKIPTKR